MTTPPRPVSPLLDRLLYCLVHLLVELFSNRLQRLVDLSPQLLPDRLERLIDLLRELLAHGLQRSIDLILELLLYRLERLIDLLLELLANRLQRLIHLLLDGLCHLLLDGYRMSSANNARLVAAGERFRGGDTTEPDASHVPGIPPAGPLTNHPSGDPTPTPEDVRVTRDLVAAGKLLDIDVLDHLVIGRGRYVSLRQKKLGFD